MNVNDVSHWTIYGVIEGAQTIELAYSQSVSHLEDLEVAGPIPTLDEVKAAMAQELEQLQQLTDPSIADMDQIFFLQIALGIKTLDDMDKYYDDRS